MRQAFVECGRWRGCDWDERQGVCLVDLNGLTAKEAAKRANRYEAIATSGNRPDDGEVRGIRRARVAAGQHQATVTEVARLLTDDYAASVPWLRHVEEAAAAGFAQIERCFTALAMGDLPAAWEHLEKAEHVEKAYPEHATAYESMRQLLTDLAARKIFARKVVRETLGLRTREEARAFVDKAMKQAAQQRESESGT